MIIRGTLFSNILAFLFVGILSLPANAKGLEEFSEELDFSSRKVFFETLTKALSNEALPQKLSETEVSAAVKIFKKIEILKRFDTLAELSEAQPTSAQTIIYNVKGFGSKASENDLRAFKSHLFELAVAEAQKKNILEDVSSSFTSKGLLSALAFAVTLKTLNEASCEPGPGVTVEFASSASTIAENAGSSLTLTATLSGAVASDVTVSLATAGTGTEGTDYGTVSDITISAGNTTGTTSFTPTDDSTYEGNETAIISVSGVSGGSVTENCTQQATITITENESAPTVTLASSASSIAENAGSSLTLTATLSVATTADVTVSITPTGTGTEGTDYGTISDITISAGSTTGTASFTPTDDSTYEGDETAIVAITGVSGGSATESGTQTTTITITENESAPTVTLASSASSIAENAGSSLTLTATLSGATDETVTVSITPTGTGTEGTDYGTISDITISAGSTTGTASFTPTDDTTYEGDETAIVAISGVSGGSATEDGTQTTTITITDNESAPTVTLTSSASSIAENSTSSLTLTATLSVATTADVTVSITPTGTATEGTDYGTISDITISAGNTTGTASFTPTDDTTYEGDETAIVAITGVSGGSATEDGTQSVTLTITENEDGPTVTLSSSASSIAEDAGSSLTLTATLSVAASGNVTVNISTSGTGIEGTDYGTISNITISAGDITGTASFTPTDDDTYEGNETAIVAISSVTGLATEDGTQAVTITITEDDSAPTVDFNDTSSSGAESVSSKALTVDLSAASGLDVTVAYAITGTATGSGTDYTLANGTLTISAGSTSGTITIASIVDDALDEADETVIVTLSSPGNATLGSDVAHTYTITDNDSAPTVDFNDTSSSGAESVSSKALTVDLSAASGLDVTVAYALTGTATGSGTDYTLANGTLTISAGSTSGTITIASIVDDSTYEGNETVIVTLSSPGNATLGSDVAHTYTITDNDSAPTVDFNDTSSSGAESVSSKALTVDLSAASGLDVTVAYAITGTATGSGTDYTLANGTLTISAGSTSGTITIASIVDDALDEADETVIVTLSSPGNATLGSDVAHTYTITDDDATPTVDFNITSSSGAESASSAALTVDLSAASGQNVTVNYAITGTATGSGTDYTLANGTLTINAGATTGTITIASIIEDALDEANETVIVTLSSPNNATLGSDDVHTYTITDNDNAPVVDFNATSSNGAESVSSKAITVDLSAASGQNVTVNYAITGTATGSGTDYTLANGTLTINAGATTGTITIASIINDALDELDETVIVTLSSPSNATLGSDSVHTYTITDNDAVPVVDFNATSSNGAESVSSKAITVDLSAASGLDVTVAYALTGTATGSGTDYTLANGTLTINAGATTGTITIASIIEDALDEANETVIVTLSSPNNATLGSDDVHTYTITDNDNAPVVDFNATSSNGAESVSSKAITVDLSAVSSQNVTVNYAITGTATGSGTDYTLANGTLTINAGATTGTITIASIINDALDELDETVIVTLSSPSNATLGSDSVHTYTITDNDAVPVVDFNATSSNGAESVSSKAITVDLSAASGQNITVNYAITGTATGSGTDYTLANGTLTISAGSTSGTITIASIVDDALDEADETVIVTLSSPGNATLGSDVAHTYTITDNDSAPTVDFNDTSSSGAESVSSKALTVDLSAASGLDVTVAYAITGTATGSGTDYTLANGTLTISAGSTSGTITIASIVDDALDEADETVIVTLSSPGNATLGSDVAHTYTITDNDSAPTVDFNDTSSSGAESVSSKALTVDLSAASGLDVTVAYALTGTATGSGTDYTLANGTLTISAGSTSGTITIASIVDDALDEADETVIVTLSSPGNATLGSDVAHTYTITDNDSAPTVDFNDTSSSGAESVSSKALTVDLSAASGLDVTVAYAITGTATGSGTDYTLANGTLTISAGSTSGTITIASIVDDSTYEGNETVIVTLSSPGNATLGSDSAHTYTITENESAPTVSLAASGTSVYDNGSNITLTATSTQIADEDITVVIGTTGTADEGSDYANISNITISAGVRTGTATFNPSEDTSNEGSEDATISISSVSGAGSSTSGTTSVTITITEYALRTGTTFADSASDSVTATTTAAVDGYASIDTTDTGTTVHPYTQMNINDVHAMTDGTNYLTGVGQMIHIADFNCNTNLDIYDGKTIHNLDDGGSGESTFQNDRETDSDGSHSHCNAVATFAVGNDTTGSNEFRGVAPDADLVLSSIPDTIGTYSGDDYAADLDLARGHGAIASNHSWTLQDSSSSAYDATEFQNFYDNYKNTYTLDEIAGFKFEGGSLTSAQTTSFQTYITALDNFQSSGVIVFANGNFYGDSDASFVASLPVWYNGGTDGKGNSVEDLSDAWLTVLYADFTGADMVNITESEFTRKGNPCGKAREFCLTVDDFQVDHASWYNEETGANNTGSGSGSSYGAPMVSGGVALVKQAFPNHTPEQIVDRILASANNSWFTALDNTTFTTHGASITHGFSNEWGHGLPDFLAAMSPITSNSNPASITTGFNLSGNSGGGSSGATSSSSSSQGRYATSASTLSVPGLMGDAISEGLRNETAYFYDGLNGGFKFDMTSLINDKSTQKAPSYNIENGFNKLGQISDTSNFDKKFNPANALAFADKEELYITLQAPNAALQQFASYSNISNFYSGSQANPFIGKTKGLGLNSEYKIGNVKTIIGYHDSSLNGAQFNDELKSKTLAASFEIDTDEDTKVGFVIGSLQEQDTFLFSKGSGALGYRDSNPKSFFTGLNLGKRVDNVSLSFSGTLAQSNMGNSTHSLVEGTSDVISSSLNASMSFHDVGTKGNKLSFSVSQPNRIEKGSLKIRVPGLADSDGNIPYSQRDLYLQSSGRQVDLSINYLQSFNSGIDFGANITKTQDYNHVSGNSSGLTFSLLGQINF